MKALVEGRYRVSIAVSGSQALDLMQRDCPDMIFMAYEMPVVNGKIIYKGIRANPHSQERTYQGNTAATAGGIYFETG